VASIASIYRFSVAKGVAVAVLGLVATSHSLSAELSLWATMRSDRVGERAATSNVAMNVRDKYQRAKFELYGLPAARSTVERLDRRNVLGASRRQAASSQCGELAPLDGPAIVTRSRSVER